MGFDHLDPTTKGEANLAHSQIVASGSMQGLIDEIAKCEVVRSNCHRIRTRDRGYAGEGNVGPGVRACLARREGIGRSEIVGFHRR